jgi:hypothetical protein
VIIHFHENPELINFGAFCMAKLVARDFYSPLIDATVQNYFAGCVVHHQITAPHHARHITSMPLPPPHRLWEGVIIHFVADQLKSTELAYTGQLVIHKQLIKMAI